MPTKTKRFFRLFNEAVIFSVLERFTALIALFEKEFRKMTGIKKIPAIII